MNFFRNLLRIIFKTKRSADKKEVISTPSIVIKEGPMGDITNNFSFYEFKPKGMSKTWKPKFKMQKLMIVELANDLQVVRKKANRSMRITSGVRAGKKDYDRLIKLGYHPSSTSDHYCGNVVSIPTKHKKRKIFGPHYCYSVGAADIVTKDMEEVFNISIDLDKQKKTNFGQIIWERNTLTGSEWIHYGNDPIKFLTPTICNLINRTRYMITIDGGKTYSVYNG